MSIENLMLHPLGLRLQRKAFTTEGTEIHRGFGLIDIMGRFRRLTPVQRNTFVACFLGWSLDAFDFFILVFCVSALATQFHAKVSEVSEGIFWTLAMRPVGAFLFGIMADKFGRRPTLMVDIIAYSVFELASA